MRIFRQHKAIRIFNIFLALYFLNVSIDAPDPNPIGVPDDLSINDMESIVEIVLEKILNINNAVPEHDEQNNPDTFFHQIKKFSLFIPIVIEPLTNTEEASERVVVSLLPAPYYSNEYSEILSPPPKV
jgi:hypothetical protein